MAGGLTALPGAGLAHPFEANEIFIRLPEATAAGMERDGVIFHRGKPARRRCRAAGHERLTHIPV